MQRDFGTHGWQFKRTIDEVVVGLRCMAGEPMTEFTPPEEFGREFHKENVSWRRQPAHRERLRPIPIPRGCANIKKLVHCVTVVEIVDELVLLCQSHVDVHGNTAVTGPGRRYSFVCYLKHALAEAVNRLEQRADA